jgi:two-component system chemotaxis sensor kinase CheA
MAIDTSQFFEIFFEETEEQLQQLEALLLALDLRAPDTESLHAIFRIAHSIKGNAGTFGFTELTELTHIMESLLDKIRHGRDRLTQQHLQLLLQARDVLQMQLDGLRHDSPVDSKRAAQVHQALEALAAHQPPASDMPAAAQDEEDGYGFFEPLPAQSFELAPIPACAASVPLAVRREDAAQHHGHEASSLRVSVEKVDQLVNLIGELVITHAMIAAGSQELDPLLHEKLLTGIDQLGRNTRELQESVMSVRMVPMDFVFSRFPRLVHELSTKLGKQVEFVTEGGATELDKGLIEKIVDPLTHLVRNSLDHGLETPAVRRQQGKSETGLLRLSASHQGGHIVVEVEDDGAGLNRDKILRKAAAQGLELPVNPSDDEVWQLIFAPGFSTAETVTDVSGRGVGMDVVRRNIAALGGTVSLDSRTGHGTRVTISLPLTLAILDGITVRVGDEIYILPLNFVVESFRLSDADLRDISGHGRVIQVRGEYIPILALHELFSVTRNPEAQAEGILVVVQSDTRRAALWVDEVVGQQQVVVKNLEANYRRVPNISGATILGDGSVSLIVDVAQLLGQQRNNHPSF